MKLRLAIAALTLLPLSLATAADELLPSRSDVSLLQEVNRAQTRGMDWLIGQQSANGAWRDHPAITGLGVMALARHGRELTAPQRAAVDRAVSFILTNVKPNGAIYGGGETDRFPNYSTAICLMALAATGDEKHLPTIRNARDFLLGIQSDAGGTLVNADDPSHGGLGYGRRGRPDLSNSSWSYEALKVSEQVLGGADDAPQTAGGLHWQKALAFVTRCQNLPRLNDQSWAKHATDEDLGGFIYMPGFSFVNEELGESQAGPLRSMGSMSYAGLKSFIYADLKQDDPRVTAVIDWLGRNYTVEQNPGMGQQGLYYYLHLMTKALTAYGADTFKTADGKTRDWRYELMRRFVQLQSHEGYWQNPNNRFWENDPVLVTTYSLIALEILQQRKHL